MRATYKLSGRYKGTKPLSSWLGQGGGDDVMGISLTNILDYNSDEGKVAQNQEEDLCDRQPSLPHQFHFILER